ncbi:MSMEG_1061 family FMN-dependent PPOX-type flavoprotein [Alkalihalobacterium chitinilyticum]|uniref:Pyridoxamine 5'-phosphate oxidase family protein n=1 Tax=Alkalihalobacterium chitinilyticum TaxID=2980103 RepID=A0ABT5VCZ6_9BACI|nr:MSMEG_1061 family FMN-dependent PPOX-type flavoprotein [Alkalihalobacterium chitinilyticum]MDE5413317.1 pyridoxamine 5'-phosphate oxidase family protein [Alkalihalobacterium chitinilyticum]
MQKINFAKNAVTSEAELRDIVGSPNQYVKNKVVSVIDEQCKTFIKMSSLLFLATSNADGKCDVSPRGDRTEAVHVLNESQLLIPDRPGNKRVDSIQNILSNPHVGLIFVIPGMNELLRINGRATIVRDSEILSTWNVEEKPPLLGIGVDVEECFIHCTKAFHRSGVWDYNSWPNVEPIPKMMDIYKEHLKINGLELSK